MKPTDKIIAHCTRCDYPIFAYHHICPMCSQPIAKDAAAVSERSKTATTRFDFWVKSVKRNLSTRPRNTASAGS